MCRQPGLKPDTLNPTNPPDHVSLHILNGNPTGLEAPIFQSFK